MKLGFSIQSPVFLGKTSRETTNDLIAHYDKVEQLLDALKTAGVSSIEVRILPRGADPASYQDVIQAIWDAGLSLSVHGHVAGEHPGSGFVEVYPSMAYILKHFHKYQNDINMTLHAFEAKTGSEDELHRETVRLLRSWAAIVDAEQLPLQFALENNRKKSSKVDPGDSIGGVVRMVEETDHPRVGICFDMGHYYSNLLNEHGMKLPPEQIMEDLPMERFLNRAFHTHIHGLGATGTHNPLTLPKSLPLEHYVNALKQAGYRGIYNLELTLDKFDKELSLSEHVLASVRRLKEAVE
ncbi:sugar phosphate isomerase/epimerase family protein [Paenibacillus thalictri]|uniref:Sugar phosphate isomerase/epimerase n=1 Tax=Paenibacillus thalictri TaxID=2527873 RepID=A0A4V2J3U4_9BACL|nr:sugar phosphate isomerase/epimerase [Paenibacillus thalictri]TBL75644.1 sugar phosphate isomerase/epimerase [Paenibacillus thalictri]